MSSTATAGASSADGSAPNAVPVAYTSNGRMRLPPSSTAWRIAPWRRCGEVAGSGSAAESAASTRVRQGPKSKSGIRGRGAEGFGVVRLFRVAEQAHAQFGLFQGGLAFAVEADAAFVGGERFFEAHVAVFHFLDQLFELVEGGFEIGDRGGLGFGGARHGAQCLTGEGSMQSSAPEGRTATHSVIAPVGAPTSRIHATGA